MSDRNPVNVAPLPWITDTSCAWCGKDPAPGFASIGDRYYCHEGEDPTCYMQALWEQAGVTDFGRLAVDVLGPDLERLSDA